MNKARNYLLVTGGAGYIGSKVCNDLIDKGHNVVVIDNLVTGNRLLVNKKAKFFDIDIKNEKKLSWFFNKFKIQAIFHFAASLSVPESQVNPSKYYNNNVLGTENILKQIAKKKLDILYFHRHVPFMVVTKKKLQKLILPLQRVITVKPNC